MADTYRTPLGHSSRPERDSAGGRQPAVRAPFIWPDHIPEPRNHDDEIRTLREMSADEVLDDYRRVPGDGWHRIETDAATVYPCVIETGGIGNLWTARNDEDFAYFDAGYARFIKYRAVALIALAAAGGWLIGGLL